MVDFNWGQAAGAAGSGGGFAVQHWWDQSSSGGGGATVSLGGPAPTPAPAAGQFSLDITSPSGVAGSVGQSAQSANDLLDQLGKALFAKQGSVLGGIPVIGDLGRFAGEAASVPVGVVRNVIGGAVSLAERIPSGNADLTGQYQQQVAPEIKAQYDQQIAADPGRAQHLMFQALQDQAQANQQTGKTAPDLFWDLKTPTGSIADSIGRVLGLASVPERFVERGFAGLTKSNGQDRIGNIESAIAASQPVTPVERVAYDQLKGGAWSKNQALDFLASNGAGFSGDRLTETVAQVLLDPLFFGSLGAAGLSKIGVAGSKLAATTAEIQKLDPAAQALLRTPGSSARLNVLGKLAESPTANGLLRFYGSHVYTPLETAQIGRVAKIARTAIDPLHAIGQNRVQSEAIADVLTETSTRALRDSVGQGNVNAALSAARDLGGQPLVDALLNGEADYVTNIGRGVVMTSTRDAAIQQGVAAELVGGPSPRAIVDELIARQPVPKDFAVRVREEMDRVGLSVATLDPQQMTDLVARISTLGAKGTTEEILARLQRLPPDALVYLHGVSYGRDIRDFLKAAQQAANQPYAGKVALARLNLMNRSTLGESDLKNLIGQLRAEPDLAAQTALLDNARTQFPALRYLTLPEGPTAARDMEKVIGALEHKLESGVGIPMKLTPDELATMPPAIRDYVATHPTRDIGFMPSEDLKWGAEQDPLTGRWTATFEPWNDVVTYDGPVYRPVSSLAYNAAGMPVIGKLAAGAGKAIDAMESGARTWSQAISSRTVLYNAEKRMVRAGVAQGATDTEMRQVFREVQHAAQLDGHTARGLTPQNLWGRINPLVPKRLKTQLDWGPHEFSSLVLHAFEGDFRVIGLTQKITGRAKTLLSFGNNATGFVAESLYPDIKFKINAVFQAQEKIEPWVWSSGRGVTPVLGRRMSAADQEWKAIFDTALSTGVMRGADLVEMAEFSPAVLAGGNDVIGRLSRAIGPRWLRDLADVKGQRQLSMMRVAENTLGREIPAAMEKVDPGAWTRIKAHWSDQAGHVLSDQEVAQKWLAEMSLGNRISVANYLRPGATTGDFINATMHEPFLPSSIGEVKALNLDPFANAVSMSVNGRTYDTAATLQRALQSGKVLWNDVATVAERMGFHPDYISRVERAFSFGWDNFWAEVKGKFGATPGEIRSLQGFVGKLAETRGASPVEYLSQILSPRVGESAKGAITGNLGDALALLRAPAEGGTADELFSQIARVFTSHLDPSARDLLVERFGQVKNLDATVADALRARVASGVADKNADVERLLRQFRVWTEDAIVKGLVADRPNRFSSLLGDVFKIPTEGAAPFSMSQQLLVNQVAESMRAAWDDAYRLMYYKQTRNFVERSLNHPMLGIYPASYMWGKVLPEMIRFITKTPFGINAGSAAYALNDISLGLAAQREWDPRFDKMMNDVGRNEVIWFMGYLLPAVPWDVGAAAPIWMRDLATQAKANQDRVDRGLQPKPIDLGQTIQKVSDYVSPLRPAKQLYQAGAGLEQALASQPVAQTPPVAPQAPSQLTVLEQELQKSLFGLQQSLTK